MLAFFGESRLPQCEQIAAEEVAAPFADLLVHDRHMTVTLEEYHSSALTVKPYESHRTGEIYGRKLDLVAQRSGKIVLTGAMLFNFSVCDDEVRNLILDGEVPLGRILIEHGILRRIATETFLRIEASDPLVERFALSQPSPAYGRLATIFYHHRPAVDLLEIVNPEL